MKCFQPRSERGGWNQYLVIIFSLYRNQGILEDNLVPEINYKTPSINTEPQNSTEVAQTLF